MVSMNFYYEIDDSIDDEVSSKPKFVLNKKFIIALLAILFFVLLIVFIIYSNPNRKYLRMEKIMLDKARNYVGINNPSIASSEIYLDLETLEVELDSSCIKTSGVFYDGNKYMPYLKCKGYESKILDNKSQSITLYGGDIIILAKGIPFYDPGYYSTKNVEVLGEVGTTEGVYNLYYYDESGQDFLMRKVVIINNDQLKANYPKITLNGEEVLYVTKGNLYQEMGARAIDLVDGDISQNIIVNGKINTDMVGKQKITYSITNSQGYQNTVERIVNVIDSDTTIYVDYVIEPSNRVNDFVVITLSIYGDIYDYVTLPSKETKNGTRINYKVSENGKYTFLIHDKMGNVIDKVIEVNNIDKDPPKALCEAIIYNGYTKIDVVSTSNKDIKTYEYQINNMSVKKNGFSSYVVNNTNVNSASVTIEDSVGNKNKVSCEVMPYETWKTDYSRLFVYLKNDANNDVVKKYSLEDYLKGVLYLSFIDDDFSNYSNTQLLNLFKSFFVLKKAELFGIGKYNVYSKQLVFNINEAKYCDVSTGCKLVGKSGKSFYLAKDINYKIDNDYKVTYDKLDDKLLEIMTIAYNETKKEIVVNNNFNEVLVRFNSSYTQITDSIKKNILDEALLNKSYQAIISNLFPNYKIYNISNYSTKFKDALKLKSNYFWPIGSMYADYYGLFSGTPESLDIIYDYGASTVDNKIHNGISIRGECNKTKVVASKDGRVSKIGFDNEYGDYVIIEHDNGVSFLYGSLSKNSISVTVGSTVKKGQLIGFVGQTNNTCMLYVEVYLNGTRINPNEYISFDNPRPIAANQIIYVEGGSVKRSVCLSLLASGFSIDATAGIMANMQRESNFILNMVGDGGTSIGLCQWHGERYSNLSNYCGNRMYTTECQLNFMLYELMNTYKVTYSYLLGNNSAYDMGSQFCFKFEAPAASSTSCPKRGEVAKSIFIPYVLNNCN